MPLPPLRVPSDLVDAETAAAAGFDAIIEELELREGFADEVSAEAERAIARGPRTSGHVDRTDVPLVTIDPPGSTDLDQAVWIGERPSGGYLVHYAIADVAAFVEPGGAIDAAARERGVTVYLPDRRVPLHPPSLSEGAASLLPDGDRPALLWEIELDRDGEPVTARLARATVRSRAKLSYAQVQSALDDGTAEEPLRLLAEVGRLREQREVDRGGVSLPLPDQQVVHSDGRYALAFRAPLPVEGWNAQISLLAGICAAELMLDAGRGVLRTLPPPDVATVDTLRRHAAALDVDWPARTAYPDAIRGLDVRRPAHAAFATQAARLFRGAGYLAFDPATPATELAGGRAEHAAVASPYGHVTAPLRRLVDRFANEVVVAHCAGEAAPGWATDALPELPRLMGGARQREGSASSRALDLVEALVLGSRHGDELTAVVVDLDDRGAQLQIDDPAVLLRVPGEGRSLGERVSLRVVGSDPVARRVDVDVLGPA